MKVNYDEVMRYLEWRMKINNAELKDIEWVRDNGDPLVFSDKLLEEWKFYGMSNIDFAREFLSVVVEGKEEELLKDIEYNQQLDQELIKNLNNLDIKKIHET